MHSQQIQQSTNKVQFGNPLQMPACHSKEREEPSMVLSHGKSTTRLPKFYEKRSMKKGTYSSIQLNRTKEWCEFLDYIRTFDISHKAPPQQLERHATLYHFAVSSTNGEMLEEKVFQFTIKLRRLQSSICKEAGQNTKSMRRNTYRENLDQKKVLRGEPILKFKFYTMASTKISRRACPGKPRSIHSRWSVESKLMDHVLVGEIRMDMEWWNLKVFFSGFAPTWRQLLGEGVHIFRVTRTFFWQFLCVVFWHRVAAQLLHKRGTHRTRLTQELQCHLCALEKSLSSGVAHVSSLVDSPASHHEHIIFLIHPSFHHDTWTRTTIGTTRSTPRNTQYIMIISMLSGSTSSAIKKNSGVKTCREAEARARQLPQRGRALQLPKRHCATSVWITTQCSKIDGK